MTGRTPEQDAAVQEHATAAREARTRMLALEGLHAAHPSVNRAREIDAARAEWRGHVEAAGVILRATRTEPAHEPRPTVGSVLRGLALTWRTHYRAARAEQERRRREAFRCRAASPAAMPGPVVHCIRDRGHDGRHGYAGMFWDAP